MNRLNTDSKKAVVLLSGGLDSYTVAALAKNLGYEIYALTVRYGQVHIHEINAARAVARALQVSKHLEISTDLATIGGSALTGAAPIPKDRPIDNSDIPKTYVPARNTVLLSLALAWSEVLDSRDLFIGVNALDYSGYPDCRQEFLDAFEQLASLATKVGVEGSRIKIHAPLIEMSKASIIRCGLDLKLDYGLTHSCYDPIRDGYPCGRCDSCRLRARGFKEAGASDPLLS